MPVVHVSLNEKSYDVKINKSLHTTIGTEINRVWTKRKITLLTDTQVGQLYLSSVEQQLKIAGYDVLTVQVPVGESSKSFDKVADIIKLMAYNGFTRNDGLISLGGGVVGDLGGLIASLYMRGVAFIQIATSLTAQVDSSVGGKTAINIENTKNIAGTFYQPDLVLVDVTYLETLNDRDLVEGYAEVVKTSALEGGSFFELTGKIKSTEDIRHYAEELSLRSIQYKANIVMADEKESHKRQYLNFGHTIGHAIELLAHGKLKHGEAVAIGMIEMSKLMTDCGYSDETVTSQLMARLVSVGLPTTSSLIGTTDFFKHLVNDKKNRSGILNIVVLQTIGEPKIIKQEISDIQHLFKNHWKE